MAGHQRTCCVEVENARFTLQSERIGGPAEEAPEIEFGARGIAEHRDGSVGGSAEAGYDVDHVTGAVERPAEGCGTRFRFHVALDFRCQTLGATVRALLFRLAHWFVCKVSISY